ncbi:hypothetical protein M3G00_10555 [Brevibacterium casei]|uniref:hypothetical protein n=1 Tax=Brevibacterium casei TaxID=33889 RepID=UPI00223B7754|nr:hypothetical protein [Brevibacterium casei]MCT2183373.1 hypothetical protein [Brevibacterium casei]
MSLSINSWSENRRFAERPIVPIHAAPEIRVAGDADFVLRVDRASAGRRRVDRAPPPDHRGAPPRYIRWLRAVS